jgi:uncharacterized membrane protein YhiD involved in acid resistance
MNEKIALWITKHVGTMTCAYIFLVIGIGSLVGIITGNTTLALACGAISSYVLQLVLLPIIIVGQNLNSKKTEQQITETHDTVMAELKLAMDERKKVKLMMKELDNKELKEAIKVLLQAQNQILEILKK